MEPRVRSACTSAGGELRVDEDAAAVERVRVLRDVRDLDVVAGLTELLRDLGVDVVLGAAGGRLVERAAVLVVAVLLRGPHQRLLLGGHLKDLGVQSLDHRVRGRRLLVNDVLGLAGQLVVEVVARREAAVRLRWGHLHCSHETHTIFQIVTVLEISFGPQGPKSALEATQGGTYLV